MSVDLGNLLRGSPKQYKRVYLKETLVYKIYIIYVYKNNSILVKQVLKYIRPLALDSMVARGTKCIRTLVAFL